MPSLPVEVWQAILEVSAAADRIRLRAVSKTLCELATPTVFRCLHFRNVPIDVKAFRNVQRSPEIVRLIEDISIIISDQEQLTWGTVGNKSGFKRHPSASAFASLLIKFPSVTHLNLSFWEAIPTSTNKLRKHILGQLQIMEAIFRDAHHSHLTSLSINNILALPDYFIESLSMAKVFASLISLDLRFVFEDDEHDIADYPSYSNSVPFPGGGVYHPSDFPRRTSTDTWKLTHLKLGSALEVAYFEPLAFSQLHCPNLESLVIEKMTFRSPTVPAPVDAAGSLENFIIRHPSLQRLALKNCTICYRRGGGQRHWSTIYDEIARKLTQLIEISIEFGPLEPDWYGNEDEGPEAWLEDGQEVQNLTLGYCEPELGGSFNEKILREYIYDPQAVERDGAALRRLRAIVEERSG